MLLGVLDLWCTVLPPHWELVLVASLLQIPSFWNAFECFICWHQDNGCWWVSGVWGSWSVCQSCFFPSLSCSSPAWPQRHPPVWSRLEAGGTSALTLLGGECPPYPLSSPMASRNPIPNTTSPCPPLAQHLPESFQSLRPSTSPCWWLPMGPTHDKGIGKCCTQSSNMEIAE